MLLHCAQRSWLLHVLLGRVGRSGWSSARLAVKLTKGRLKVELASASRRIACVCLPLLFPTSHFITLGDPRSTLVPLLDHGSVIRLISSRCSEDCNGVRMRWRRMSEHK